MSEYEQIIDEIVKHGVVINVNKIVDDNYINHERKYVGCVVELDFSEHDKVFEDKIASLEENVGYYKDSLSRVEKNCDKLYHENKELKQRIAELESKETSELPFGPLECANYLINATYERETSSLERGLKGLPEKVNSDRYTVDDLEQIAEHLLIYCKHNKELE